MSDASGKYGKKMIILYPLLNEQNANKVCFYKYTLVSYLSFCNTCTRSDNSNKGMHVFYPKQLGSINRILRGK